MMYRTRRESLLHNNDVAGNQQINNAALERWSQDYAIAKDDDGYVAIPHALQPGYYATNPTYANGPDDYPAGFTICLLSSASSWPHANGTVETFQDNANDRAWQVCKKSTQGPEYIRYWASDTSWGSWRLTGVVLKGGSDDTRFTETTTGSWQTQQSYAVTSILPSTDFYAEVQVNASNWVYYNGTALVRSQIGISLDGGSTYTYGRAAIQSLDTTIDFASCSFGAIVSGAVTGVIYVRYQLYTDTASAQADDLQYNVTIGPDY